MISSNILSWDIDLTLRIRTSWRRFFWVPVDRQFAAWLVLMSRWRPWPITCATVFRPHAQKNSMPIGWWHTLILPGGPAIASVCSPSINLFFAQPLSRFHEPDAHAVACQAKQVTQTRPRIYRMHQIQLWDVQGTSSFYVSPSHGRPAAAAAAARDGVPRRGRPAHTDETKTTPVRHHRFNLHLWSAEARTK